jgi:Cu/Ag efflux protein CusF
MPTVRRAAGPGTIVLLLVASIAMAQVRLTLRGTIKNAEGQTLVVKLQDGTMKNVQLADDVHVFAIKKSSLVTIKHGSIVAVTASRQMDDSQKASEIYIFPDQPGTSRALRQKLPQGARFWSTSTARS